MSSIQFEPSSFSTELDLSPSIFADLGPLLDTDSFEPFSQNGPSSPVFDLSGDLHEEVHPEVCEPVSFEVLNSTLPSVPDVSSTDMEQDDSALNELLNLEPEFTPDWAKQSAMAPMEIKSEEFVVPQEHRPKQGPGSRRKLKEEIRDDLDVTIYSLFPADVLRLPRVEFQKWRDESGMRPLTVPEQKRLSKIRRMILARVYAERTRLRKIDESRNNGQTLSALKAENTRLRKKAAKLEAAQSKLMQRVKQLLALQNK